MTHKIDSCYGRIDSGLEFVLKEWFQTVDQDRSGHIDRNELKMALNAAGETFSESTIRMMVDMFDTDRNGTIDFNGLPPPPLLLPFLSYSWFLVVVVVFIVVVTLWLCRGLWWIARCKGSKHDPLSSRPERSPHR